MSTVAKKTSTSKKARIDRRILTQAERENHGETTELGELEVLRKLADIAAGIYESGDETEATAEAVLREALRTASADLDLLSEASGNGLGGPDSMSFVRAQRRIELALALSEYRADFRAKDDVGESAAVAS
jgi:hypothetical protein